MRWQGRPYYKSRPRQIVREGEVRREKVVNFLATGSLKDEHPAITNETDGPGPLGTAQGEGC